MEEEFENRVLELLSDFRVITTKFEELDEKIRKLSERVNNLSNFIDIKFMVDDK